MAFTTNEELVLKAVAQKIIARKQAANALAVKRDAYRAAVKNFYDALAAIKTEQVSGLEKIEVVDPVAAQTIETIHKPLIETALSDLEQTVAAAQSDIAG